MNPDRRNGLVLTAVTWAMLAVGCMTVGWHWQRQATRELPRLEGDDLLLNLMFPLTGLAVGLIACFERPRSGAKPSLSPLALLPTLGCGSLAGGVLFLWLRTPH